MARTRWLRLLLLLSGAWLLLGVLASGGIYLLTLAEPPPGEGPGAMGVLLQQGPRWLGWIVLTPLVLWLARRFPLRADRIVRGLGLHAVVGTAVAIVHVGGLAWSHHLTLPSFPAGPDPVSFYLGFAATQLPFALLAYAALVGGVTAWDYYGKLRDRELRTARLEARLHEAQLEALRAHLDPHFLFNALQTASSLVRSDADGAVRTLARLGDLLRASLERRRSPHVSLDQELQLLDPYLEIVRTRFPDRLTVSIHVPDDARSARVPPFLLQPLVENAIRHGIEPRSAPGRVEVEARAEDHGVVIAVRDDGGGRPAPPASTWSEGTGLRVTRERLEALYPDAHDLEISTRARGGAEVVIRLPGSYSGGERSPSPPTAP